MLYANYLNLVVNPHGVRGYLIALVLPPWGWSTGFFATPRDLGAIPLTRGVRAEVILIFFRFGSEDLPKDPIAKIDIIFLTPEGSFTRDKLVLGSSFRILLAEPGLLDSVVPRPGCTSRWLTGVCLGRWATM